MEDQISSTGPSNQRASLFGKLPTVLDYVRINHDSPAAIALDEWLSRALQDLTVAGQTFSSARFRFLFAPQGSDQALVGVLGPSRDRAGRKFPLSVFTAVPIRAIARTFASTPGACAAFFAAADAILDAAPTLTREEAAERLARLEAPSLSAFLAQGEALRSQLAERSFAAFSDSLFGSQPVAAEAGLGRAVSTLVQVRMGALDRVNVLDCPVKDEQDVLAWLALGQNVLSWPDAVPSLFWTTRTEPGRLLMALGPPPPALPLWLADKKRKSERLITLGGSLPTAGDTPSIEDTHGQATPLTDGPSLLDKLEGLAATA